MISTIERSKQLIMKETFFQQLYNPQMLTLASYKSEVSSLLKSQSVS